jgi:hypothetical protein
VVEGGVKIRDDVEYLEVVFGQPTKARLLGSRRTGKPGWLRKWKCATGPKTKPSRADFLNNQGVTIYYPFAFTGQPNPALPVFSNDLVSVCNVSRDTAFCGSRQLIPIRELREPRKAKAALNQHILPNHTSHQTTNTLTYPKCLQPQQRPYLSSQETYPLPLSFFSQQQIIMAAQLRARANEWLGFC